MARLIELIGKFEMEKKIPAYFIVNRFIFLLAFLIIQI